MLLGPEPENRYEPLGYRRAGEERVSGSAGLFAGVDPVFDTLGSFAEAQVRPASTVAGCDGVVESNDVARQRVGHAIGERARPSR